MAPRSGHQLLVGDVFRQAARAVPGRTAVVVDDAALTFAELQQRADAMAMRLGAAGVSHGHRLAVWSATALDLVPLFAACAQLGAVFVPLNPNVPAAEAAAVLAVARPSALVTDADRAAIAAGLGRAVLHLDALATHPAEPAGDADLATNPVLAEHDPHVVFFTSGSTGAPKGVVLSHRVNVLRTHPGAQFEPRGTAVCVFPLFHMAAWTIALQQWQARAAVVFAAPQAGAICGAVARHHATRLNAVPLVWHRVLDHLAADATAGGALSSLRFADTGTSATPPELLASMRAALPDANVRVFYGSTEAGNVTTLEHDDAERKPGRVGVPSVHTELRVDGTGELLVRSPLLFDGYFEDEAATATALVDGWYRTGDLAEIDDEGFVSIVGRARDVIRTGGETVAPAEVEAALATFASLADVAVVGVPDPQWGEVVCAVVVTAAGHDVPSVDDLRRHCEGRLAPFKCPRRVVAVEAIPRTDTTGQVQRRLVVERLAVADA